MTARAQINHAHQKLGSMRDVAERTLAEAQAMQALASCEPSLLALIDRAAAGEASTADAEDALAKHLAAREVRVAALQELNSAWSDAVARAGGLPDNTLSEIAAEISRALLAIEVSDARFAAELAERRRVAHVEVGRADAGRAAQRAYGPTGGVTQPRFTDRRG